MKKLIFYFIILVKMNLVPKMNQIRVLKVHLKKTQVLKKNLLWFWAIVLNTSQAHWSGAMEWNLGHSFFWSGATERSGAAFLERSEKRS